MKYPVGNPEEHHLHYNIKKWGKQVSFYILRDISENVTFVQLMDSVVNVNHAVSIVGYCIFEYNYTKALSLTPY